MKIELVSYRESWPADFERIKARLQELVGSLKPRFEHIGSTSVSGLCAKPIIDVMAGLHDEADLDKTVRLLQNSEFIYMPVYRFSERESPFL
ncbi:GrpB family protein [Metabacillus sp. 84]|uniref:GrpB family protein n=1 Tax=Metabacillus sp. 84 TaxID=3404705 RepID=UPI003CF4AF9D